MNSLVWKSRWTCRKGCSAAAIRASIDGDRFLDVPGMQPVEIDPARQIVGDGAVSLDPLGRAHTDDRHVGEGVGQHEAQQGLWQVDATVDTGVETAQPPLED